MRLGLTPSAAARFIVATIARPKIESADCSSCNASAASTSPPGSTCSQRGCLRPVAKALTLSPGAACGVWPESQPRAVGIFSVGSAPCGRAGGMAGRGPTAGCDGVPRSRRQATVATL